MKDQKQKEYGQKDYAGDINRSGEALILDREQYT